MANNPKITDSEVAFIDRLRSHPELKERMESIMKIADATDGQPLRADEVEQKLIEELRKVGNESLTAWASSSARRTSDLFAEKKEPGTRRSGQKNSIGLAPLVK